MADVNPINRSAQQASQQAAVRARYQAQQIAQRAAMRRRQMYLPPFPVRHVIDTIDPGDRETLAGVGLELAQAVDPSASVEAQLEEITALLERFEARIGPIVESTREAVAQALSEWSDIAYDDNGPAAKPSPESTGAIAAAVLIIAGLIATGAIANLIRERDYSNAILWALALLSVLKNELSD